MALNGKGVFVRESRCSKATAELEHISGAKSLLNQKPSATIVCNARSGPGLLSPVSYQKDAKIEADKTHIVTPIATMSAA